MRYEMGGDPQRELKNLELAVELGDPLLVSGRPGSGRGGP